MNPCNWFRKLGETSCCSPRARDARPASCGLRRWRWTPPPAAKGLGSRLLEAVFDKARLEGFRVVRLKVVDTNTRARRLYERLEFAVVKTQHYPFTRAWLGFSGDHVMIKEV
jgi:GNAT superfamily N-acetyltransferase